MDPRTPVVVGVGQRTRLPDPSADLTTLAEPVDMMAEVLRAAAADSGAGDAIIAAADSVRVVAVLSWHYANPALLLAERLRASPRQLLVSTTGGNSPQMLVNDAARSISRGELDVVLIAGAEGVYTRLAALKEERRAWLPWTVQDDGVPSPDVLGGDRQPSHQAESARSVALPVQMYPVFENALRASAGRDLESHQRRVAEMWSRFSEVASSNPHAWSRRRLSAEEIATPGPSNRMIAFPYPKLMNANIQTDQAAGLVVCSLEAARAAGVADDRLVFPRSGAEAHDHWYVSERADLHSSPAIRLAGREALGLAGVGADDVAHLDLYSCFPSAVQIAAAELCVGIDERDRPLTVTGGLGFAGGPGNNYASHAICSMVEALRADPGSYGLVTSLGWFVTKHALGVYSTTPPADGFRWASAQEGVDSLERREVATDYEGEAVVESYTVTYERDGRPASGVVAALTPDGRRTWGSVDDEGGLGEMSTAEQCGRAVRLGPEGRAQLA